MSNNNLVRLADRRWAHARQRAAELMERLTPEELSVLQDDILARAPGFKSLIPSVLQASFREWLREGYDPIERETLMALENQASTEQRFLEELVGMPDSEADLHEKALAIMILKGGPCVRLV